MLPETSQAHGKTGMVTSQASTLLLAGLHRCLHALQNSNLRNVVAATLHETAMPLHNHSMSASSQTGLLLQAPTQHQPNT